MLHPLLVDAPVRTFTRTSDAWKSSCDVRFVSPIISLCLRLCVFVVNETKLRRDNAARPEKCSPRGSAKLC